MLHQDNHVETCEIENNKVNNVVQTKEIVNKTEDKYLDMISKENNSSLNDSKKNIVSTSVIEDDTPVNYESTKNNTLNNNDKTGESLSIHSYNSGCDKNILTQNNEDSISNSINSGAEEFPMKPNEKKSFWSHFRLNKNILFKYVFTKQFAIIFILGQMCSWSIVGTNTLTTFLVQNGNAVPAFQSFFNYAILGFFFSLYSLYRYGFKKYGRILIFDSWKFFLFAFADVEGNYFVVKAYQYTDLLSAEMLDMWAIVVVMILSFFFLKVKYHWTQILGALICIGGMSLVVVSDVLSGKNYKGSSVIKGDFFVVIGATCYGISNVSQEYFISKRPYYEVLSLLGVWGSIISAVQIAIFERNSMKEANWGSSVGGYFAGYTLILLFLYLACPILFRMSSAAFYNLALLTSDFWGLLIGIKIFHYYVYWLYPIGFVFTIVGMILYNCYIIKEKGEAVKPWLGKNQAKGIVGVGTAKREDDAGTDDIIKEDLDDLESSYRVESYSESVRRPI